MAQLSSLIVNGVSRLLSKLYVSDSVTAPTFIGKLQGNADTATKATSADRATKATTADNATKANGHTVNSDVPAGAKFTDTVYTHPTTSGNKHIPSGGSSGQILRWSADGTAAWGADNNTTYSAATTSTAGLMSAADKTKLDGVATGANKYTHPTYTAKSAGLYKVTVDSTGHVSTTAAVTKADITALGIPGSDTNTDTKVTQTAVKDSDYTNWRSLLWGASNSGTEGFSPSTVTDSVFSSTALSVQPSTGTIKATTFKGALNGNATSATKVNGHTVNSDVPANAKFTDTNTWRGIQNNLTSTATDQSLSAAQGKVLNEKFASYVPTTRTVNGKALNANISLSASDVGASASGHTHRRVSMVGSDTANTSGWYKVADQTFSGYDDSNVLFAVTSTYAHYFVGILSLQMRSDNTKISCGRLSWLTRSGFAVGDAIVNISGMKMTLYINQRSAQYGRIQCEIISESSIDGSSSGLTLYNTSTKESTTPTATVTASDGSTVNYANSAGAVAWGNVSGKPSTFTPASHNHNIESLTNFSNRVYDATISRTANTVLAAPNSSNGTATFRKLVAADLPSHTHNYAGSSSAGGSATSAVKLDTATAGSSTRPVYFSNGKPTACTYTLGASVPSGAKFTDTNTWRGIQNNLTSTSTTESLAAAQGKVLNEKFNSYVKEVNFGDTGVVVTKGDSSEKTIMLNGKYNAAALNSRYTTSARATSANVNFSSDQYNNKVNYMLATHVMKEGKPPVDSHILSFGWDGGNGWGAQLAIGDSKDNHLYIRGAEDKMVNNKKTSSYEDWKTIIDSTNISSFLLALKKELYPVGHIIMTSKSENPSTYLGFGTWVAWGSGRVPVGVNTSDKDFATVEKTGGSKTTNLEHQHTESVGADASKMYISGSSSGGLYGSSTTTTGAMSWNGSVNSGTVRLNYTQKSLSGGKTIVQPYITCYMWKRTE